MTTPKIPTLREYFEATTPKRKKGVDPVRSAKAKAAIAAEKKRAEQFARLCRATVGPRRIPEPTLQFEAVLHLGREYRWDAAWPEHKVLLEVHGGVWSGGAHARGVGVTRDMHKATLAAIAGYRCIYTTPAQLLKPETLAIVQAALHGPAQAGETKWEGR